MPVGVFEGDPVGGLLGDVVGKDDGAAVVGNLVGLSLGAGESVGTGLGNPLG